MTDAEHIKRISQFVGKFNQGSLDSLPDYISRDFFNHSPAAGEPTAVEFLQELFADIRAAFPDLQASLHDLDAREGLFKGRMHFQGTHRGGLWGAPASGKSVDWSAEIAIRPVGECYAFSLENLALPDVLGLLRQFELVPPPDKMDQPAKHPVSIPELLLKVLFTGQVADKECSHLGDIQVTQTDAQVCEKCVAAGDIWPALRMCLICGFVGCCDTSKNKHMKQHYEATGHSLFRSIRMQEGWVWCYEDNAFFSKRILENK